MNGDMFHAIRLKKMIMVDTVSIKDYYDKDKFEAFHMVLRELFPLCFEKMEVKEFSGALLLRWKSESAKGDPVLLMSHQDVVEASGCWQHPPFSGDIENGVIWGRGTVDTKGSLYCIFQAVEELLEEDFRPSVDIYIASSCNEETSGPGAADTAAYLKSQGVRLQFLLDEGGMIKAEPLKGALGRFAMIGCVEKGTGNFKFIARSAGGHASTPGRNTPLVRLAAFILDVEKHSPFKAEMNSTSCEMLRRLGKHMSGPLGFVFRHSKGFSPLLEFLLPRVNRLASAMITTTIAFTTAKGSDGLNVLPQEAYVTGNIRFSHQQGVEATFSALKKIAARHDVEVEMIEGHDAYPVVDYNSRAFHMVEDVIKEVFPSVIPVPYCMTGGTDARHYSELTENAIRFAPLEINEQQYKSIHGIDENINIDTLSKGVEFYKRILSKA